MELRIQFSFKQGHTFHRSEAIDKFSIKHILCYKERYRYFERYKAKRVNERVSD